MVSVIVPIYNVELYINKCIDSVLEQSYNDFELILVDDGSPDKCPLICDEYAKLDKRITVIHKENGGLSSARNAGIDNAHGEYIYFLDGDDYIEKNTLEKAINATENGRADIVILGVEIHTIAKGREINNHTLIRNRSVLENEEIYKNLGFMVSNSMWNYAWDKLYRRNTIISNNIRYNSYFDRVCEDTVFLYDLLPFVHSIVTLEDICYHYVIRDNQSVVRKFIPDRFEKYIGRLVRLNEIINSFSNTDENKQIFAKQYLFSVVWAYENLFNEGCTFNFIQRLNYLNWMKSTDSIISTNRLAIANRFSRIKDELDISRASQLAVGQYLRGNTFNMWVIHMAIIFRSKWMKI